MEAKEEIILNKIIYTINSTLSPKRIYLFGSRGKGNAKYNSDYDIAIDGKKPSSKILLQIEEEIEEILGLHKFDLVFLENVDKELIKIIKKSGKIIYERRN